MYQPVSSRFLSHCLKNGPNLRTDAVLIATDLENVCPLLNENLSAAVNKSGKIDYPGPRILVRPLEWGNPNHTLKIFSELDPRSLTHIICSDLVSFHHREWKERIFICYSPPHLGLLSSSAGSSFAFPDSPHLPTTLIATANNHRLI